MSQFYKGEALTVGDLRRALEGVPDTYELGAASFGLVGHVDVITKICLVKEGELFVLSTDKHAGTFTEDELTKDQITTLVEKET